MCVVGLSINVVRPVGVDRRSKLPVAVVSVTVYLLVLGDGVDLIRSIFMEVSILSPA